MYLLSLTVISNYLHSTLEDSVLIYSHLTTGIPICFSAYILCQKSVTKNFYTIFTSWDSLYTLLFTPAVPMKSNFVGLSDHGHISFHLYTHCTSITLLVITYNIMYNIYNISIILNIRIITIIIHLDHPQVRKHHHYHYTTKYLTRTMGHIFYAW